MRTIGTKKTERMTGNIMMVNISKYIHFTCALFFGRCRILYLYFHSLLFDKVRKFVFLVVTTSSKEHKPKWKIFSMRRMTSKIVAYFNNNNFLFQKIACWSSRIYRVLHVFMPKAITKRKLFLKEESSIRTIHEMKCLKVVVPATVYCIYEKIRFPSLSIRLYRSSEKHLV